MREEDHRHCQEEDHRHCQEEDHRHCQEEDHRDQEEEDHKRIHVGDNIQQEVVHNWKKQQERKKGCQKTEKQRGKRWGKHTKDILLAVDRIGNREEGRIVSHWEEGRIVSQQSPEEALKEEGHIERHFG